MSRTEKFSLNVDVRDLFTGEIRLIAGEDLLFDTKLEWGQERPLGAALWELCLEQLLANPPTAPCEATVVRAYVSRV